MIISAGYPYSYGSTEVYESLAGDWVAKSNTTEFDPLYWFTTVGMKNRIYLFGKDHLLRI